MMSVNDEEILHAAAALERGELVAFPTETVYGLGADASNDHAVAKIYEAKERPKFNPLIVHVGSLQAASALGALNDTAKTLAEALWPGPLTLVLQRSATAPVSLLACAGLPSIAVRVPAHPIALRLINEVGRPIVAPSANRSGRMSPTMSEHVRQGLGGKVAVILDGGACPVGLESTIIDCRDDVPRLLRPGGLARETIEERLGRKLAEAGDGAPVAPGQLESHYAPSSRLRLNAETPRNGEAYLAFGPSGSHPRTLNLSPSQDLREAAANLFRMLHALDATSPSSIAVAPIPDEGLGEAINDRLRRAAAPRR